MKDLAYYRREHKVLENLIIRIEAEISNPKFQAWRILQFVSLLKTATIIHVITEDNDFYPGIARCCVDALTSRIELLKVNFQGIETSFAEFEKNWPPATASRNPAMFAQDIREVLKVLSKRIMEENKIINLAKTLGVDLSSF